MINFKELVPFHVLLCITFIISGLTVNLVQLLLYISLSGINLNLFRRVNYYFIYIIYSQLLFLADWWSGSTLNVHCNPEILAEVGNEPALIIMNHHYELDWLYGWMVGDRSNILGNCRVYVKKMLQYVPIIGWAWRMSDIVFLERNWEEDKAKLAQKLNNLLNYPSPVWILLFPEGTRFSPEKHEASVQFARSRNMPELKHHLIPRTKGFSFTISQLDGNSKWVLYDVTLIAGTGNSAPPTLTSVLRGHRTEANLYIRKFTLGDIPKDEQGSSNWLMERFREKDKIKDIFLTTGSFAQVEGASRAKTVQIQARYWSLIITLLANTFVHVPLILLAFHGGFYTRAGIAVVFLLAWVAMRKLVNITKISKSSAYGKKTN